MVKTIDNGCWVKGTSQIR